MNWNRQGWTRMPVLVAALLVGTAGAQDLGAYKQLASNLDEAVRVRTQSAQASLTRLDAAGIALTQLKPTLRNRQLAAGLDDAMSSSRAALGRTPAELEAQVMLARGLMRKALYDQTLAQLVTGPANGTAQLQLLTREFGLSPEGTKAVMQENKAGHPERVAWRLQRAAASRVMMSLNDTRAERTTASYVSLARATSWFTVLQDTAGSSGLQVSQFGDALRQLTSGKTTDLAASLTVLRQGTAVLVKTLRPEPQALAARTGTQRVTPGTTPTPAVVVRTPAVVSGARSTAGGTPQTAVTQSVDAASLRTARGYTDLVFNLTAAQSRSALRVSDVQALIAQTANLEAAAAGRETSTLDSVSAGVARSVTAEKRTRIPLSSLNA